MTFNPKPHLRLIALASSLAITCGSSHAEESGIGHYNPGQTADFSDALLGKPGFAYVNIFTYYGGAAGGSQSLPVSGARIAAGLDASSYTDSSVFLWETPLKLFGGYYTVFASLPYTWLTVSGDVKTPIGSTLSTSDSTNDIGDIYFSPLTIGWSEGDFKWDARFGIYAPTGGYDSSSLANTGLGFWTFEPEVTFSWLSSKTGLEVSAFAGLDFNTQNTEATYQSGDVFHIDATVAQHFPLWRGIIGIGANAFWIRQFTDDSGSGATLGGFRLAESGIGPVVSYIHKFEKTELAIEAKWLPQIDEENTMKGDYVWVKCALVF